MKKIKIQKKNDISRVETGDESYLCVFILAYNYLHVLPYLFEITEQSVIFRRFQHSSSKFNQKIKNFFFVFNHNVLCVNFINFLVLFFVLINL